MRVADWVGYSEGVDVTKVDRNYLTYPTNNVLIYKGKAYKRPGTEAYGAAATTDDGIHGEYNWKNAPSGRVALRTTGQKLQAWLEPFKDGADWVDIFDALDADVTRVRFAKFIDTNDPIVHTRLVFVDGSEDIYSWNGAVGVVDSISSSTITIAGTKTCEALGFDDGSGTAQTVIINGTEYTYNNDPTGNDLELTSTPTGVNPGDLVIAKPVVSTTLLTGFNKDHIWAFKNHIAVANLESGQIYFSHISDWPLNFTVPAPASRTAATAFFVNFDSNITANSERKGALWVSTEDDWHKITKLDTANSYDLFVEVEKIETTEKNGALPFCVTSYKGDTMFVAQDKTVQMITDNDIVQQDAVKLLSDEIALLLERTNLTEARVAVFDRYFFIIAPASATTIILDMVDGVWQPPQIIDMSMMTVIGGVMVGHSSSADVSFYLFKGRQDLGIDFSATFAIGYLDQGDEFVYKQFGRHAFSGRMTESAQIEWLTQYETDGDKAETTRTFTGKDVRLYSSNQLLPWGSAPFGSTPYAGEQLPDNSDIKRCYVFDKGTSYPYFEYRTIITVSGEESAFELLAYMTDERAASRKVGNEHYVVT